MIHIPAEIKQRVEQKVDACIKIANSYYNKPFVRPTIDYSLRGTTAGLACLSKNQIRLNGYFLLNETETFLNRTVPHEVAHLICNVLHPHVHQRIRGQKSSPHGYEWQSIMLTLGVEPTRCHSYDVSNLPQRSRSQYVYHCSRCNKQYIIGPKRHSKMMANPAAYRCRCSMDSKLVQSSTPEPQTNQPAITDKQTAALDIYNKMKNSAAANVINAIATQTGMTKANARYYYTKFQKA